LTKPLSPDAPRKALRALGLAPSRRRGQNFLKDAGLARRLAEAVVGLARSGGETGPIVEIGPGLGALTRPLLAAGAQVAAVELDRGLARALSAWPEAAEGRLEVLNRDILGLSLSELGPGPFAVAGNLPYNLSTPILFWFLAQAPLAKAGVFMLQKEMAQSLLAKPGQERYGRLSVALSLWAEASLIMEAPPAAFQPRPKVHGVAVALVPKAPPALSLKSLGAFTANAFRARRKTLANNLSPAYGQARAMAAMAALGVDPGIRAEKLAPEALAELAKLLEEGGGEGA
jgi:16S rRNA (adenine1518-N6/adenine1519-N6)-dimethyltransferase